MDLKRRGYLEFSPISDFMQMFNDVLRHTDLTPGYIDTNHAGNCVCVMGISEQFEPVPEGDMTPFYALAAVHTEDTDELLSVEFIPTNKVAH